MLKQCLPLRTEHRLKIKLVSYSIIYSIFAKKKVIMKYTDKDIQQAIELSQYAANKCSELEDYSIEMEEQLFRLQRKCSLIRTLQITTPISLLIGLLLGLLI